MQKVLQAWPQTERFNNLFRIVGLISIKSAVIMRTSSFSQRFWMALVRCCAKMIQIGCDDASLGNSSPLISTYL